METPHEDLTSKWGFLSSIGTVIGAGFAGALAHWKALQFRSKESTGPDGKISLRSLDKRIREHDDRLDEIDLSLTRNERRSAQRHEEIMQQLKIIVGREPGS